jgi:hypothetical protein
MAWKLTNIKSLGRYGEKCILWKLKINIYAWLIQYQSGIQRQQPYFKMELKKASIFFGSRRPAVRTPLQRSTAKG